jgi:cytochrome c1
MRFPFLNSATSVPDGSNNTAAARVNLMPAGERLQDEHPVERAVDNGLYLRHGIPSPSRQIGLSD